MKCFFCFIAICLCSKIYAQDWISVSIENGLSVQFPAEPMVQQIDPSRMSYGCKVGNCTFSVLKSQIEKERLPIDSTDEQRILALVLGVAKAKQNHSFIAQNSFKAGNISGMEVVQISNHPGYKESGKMYKRAFFFEGSLYQVLCFYIDGNDHSCDQNREVFFNSLLKQ